MHRLEQEMQPIASLAILLGLAGCAAHGAPSFILFGAYFPDWMFCGVVGITTALVARIAMVATGLSEILPFQLFVCTSIGLILAVSTWLLWFGR